MANDIDRKIAQIRRHLLLRRWLQKQSAAWMIAFGHLAAFLVVHGLLRGPLTRTELFAAFGGTAIGAFVAACLWNLQNRPSKLLAALTLDETFQLQQRTTTFCSLSDEQKNSPAGQALVADLERQIYKADATRLPLELGRQAFTRPVAAIFAAVLAATLTPTLPSREPSNPIAAKNDVPEVKQHLDNLKKVIFAPTKNPDDKTKEMKEIEEQLKKLLEEPIDGKNEEQVRETIQKVRGIEDKMKDRARELKELQNKNNQLQKALGQLSKDKFQEREGPAKDFRDALAQKNVDKAVDEIDKLMKKINDDKLDPKEQEALQKQLQELQERLQKMLNDREKEQARLQDELQKLRERLDELPTDDDVKKAEDKLAKDDVEGAKEEVEKLKKKNKNKELEKQIQDIQDKLNKLAGAKGADREKQLQQLKDQFDQLREKLAQDLANLDNEAQLDQQELDQLNDDLADLEDLKDLAEMLKECQQCMGKKDGKGASAKLQAMKAALKKMKLTDRELRDLLENGGNLEQMREQLLLTLKARGGMPGRPGQGMGAGGPPGGNRPVGAPPENFERDPSRTPTELDTKGQLRIVGFGKGGPFQKVPAKDVGGAFRQSAQEAPEVLDRQRIPAEAADIAKGYFQKLSGQK